MTESSLHLSLSNAELELLDCKLAVITAIKEEQRKRKLTTEKLAARLGLSRSRAESLLEGDADFSLDEIATAFFRLDMDRSDLGAAIQRDVASAWGVDAPATKAAKPKAVRRASTSTKAPAREATRRAA